MAKYAIAYQLRGTCFEMIRVVDTETKQCEDMQALDVFTQLNDKRCNFKLENMTIDYERNTLKFIRCKEICLLNSKLNPLMNSNALIVVGIDGEFVNITNYEGKIFRLHMVQVANNVNSGKYVLCNAIVLPNRWIKFMTD